jgi:hypothetical protein
VSLFRVNSDDCKGIWEAKDIAFGETIGGDNCHPYLLFATNEERLAKKIIGNKEQRDSQHRWRRN